MSADAIRRTFVLANEFKEGDLLVGGTRDERIRGEARQELAAMRLADIRRAVFVDDGVTAALDRGRARDRDAELDRLTVGDVRAALLGGNGAAWATTYRDAIASEVTAAVVKVMSLDELGVVARTISNPLPARGDRPEPAPGEVRIGAPRHLGSRIQPNSPGDDEGEILLSILEGLTYGCGDVIIGLNPAADEVETIVRLERLLEQVVKRLDLPTRYCVLSDIVKQDQARAQARVDVGFQSLAGTSSALAGMVGLDVDGVLSLARGFNGLYFETGQGSAVTNGTAQGVDMVTLEARAYGVARHIQRQTGAWTIVNDVAGFIGPEVFRTPEQLERACLEDLVMARLHGLTMGLDVCATFHMGIPPADLRAVTARVVERGAPAYLMAVAGNANPMLGYMTTAFRDHPRLRMKSGARMTSAMQRRLTALGAGDTAALYAIYASAGGDTRSADALRAEGLRRIAAMRERGFDIGSEPRRPAEAGHHGSEAGHYGSDAADARLEAIYEHARRALYATIDDSVLRDACPVRVRVKTRAEDRDDYLAHPPAGERLRGQDVAVLRAAYPHQHPQVQIVVSDGLNANGINGQLRALLPAVKRLLADSGCAVGATDAVIRNGRVRAGYHVGAVLDPEVVVHVIGERPGTGLDTVSAYLTYGRDEAGWSRWDPQMDHSWTTAVCGIHPQGKHPDIASAEIARAVVRILDQRRSGVALR